MIIRLVQRHVVFVDQQDGLLAVVLFQQRTEQRQTVLYVDALRSISEQSFHGFLFDVGQRVTVHQKLKTDTFLPDDFPKHVICVLECQPIHVLERNEYHGVFPHVFLAELLLFRNPQAIEKALVCSNLKKALQHAHVERLAEPARAREKVDLAPVSHEVDDHPRLVYIVKILAAQLFKAVDSHR